MTSAVQPRMTLGATTSVPALVVKIVALGLVVGLAIAMTPPIAASGQWAMLVALWVGVVGLLVVYSTKRLVPLKYILPGTLLLAVFVIVPIAQTVQLSFTNAGDGARTSKSEAVASILAGSVTQVEGSPEYTMRVARGDGGLALLLVDPATDDVFVGTTAGLDALDGATVDDGRVTAADGYELLTPAEINASAEVAELRVPGVDGGEIRALGFDRAFEGVQTLTYDEGTDTLTDAETGAEYTVQVFGDREYFADENGVRAFDQSWQQFVGFENYARLFTDAQLRGAFLGAFAWTLAFAVFSVVLNFGLGLALAVALNDRRVRGLRFYRAGLIVPYAIPVFISFIVWQSFWNTEFGLVNSLLGGAGIDWLGDPWLAKIAILVTNLWVGFPYMFLICTGALQSLPGDVVEAAKLDGATGFTAFARVQFPLLLVAVAPLLVSTFAFNFNNFNVIELVTGGGPFPASGGQIGATDLLISATYRIAFGGAGAQFGFASAVSVVLFIVTALLAAVQFRSTRALEDVR